MAVPRWMGCFTPGVVAHTDPSSVVIDCGICHTLFCEWTDGSHSVWMDGPKIKKVFPRSGASSSSKQTGASRVPTMFGS